MVSGICHRGMEGSEKNRTSGEEQAKVLFWITFIIYSLALQTSR